MSIEREDIELLKRWRDEWKTLDEIIKSWEEILEMNELKSRLKEIWNQLSFKFQKVVEENIQKIFELKTDEQKLNFIVSQAFESYKSDVLEAQKEQEELEKAQEK